MKITRRKSLAYYRLILQMTEGKIKKNKSTLSKYRARLEKHQKIAQSLAEMCNTLTIRSLELSEDAAAIEHKIVIAKKFNAEEIAHTKINDRDHLIIRIGETWYRPVNPEPMNENSQWHLNAVKPSKEAQ